MMMIKKKYGLTEYGELINEETGRVYTVKGICAIDLCCKLNELCEKNEQLKKRNNNQYNQLNQLWQLIEAKDWETLTTMNNKIKEDEERLQREWRCYE